MRLWQDNGATRVFAIMIGALLIVALGFVILWLIPKDRIDYSMGLESLETDSLTAAVTDVLPTPFVVTHVSTPKAVKAVYMTSWAAGNQKFRKELFDLVDNTEINSVVIDVKDYSGRISFPMDNQEIKNSGAVEKRIPDIKEFIGKLHDKGVYVIARISSFQDSHLINVRPELAVRTGEGKIWQDYKGVKWLDPGAEPVWKYLVTIGKESYAVGFDELNFDYIRYPSDGNMKDIVYSWSSGRTRQEVMRSFFMYLREQFATSSIPLSADLFGLTTSSNDDLGIGQSLSDALMYFDYVSPMVYPSHFSSGYLNYTKPADHPYEVIKNSMDQGILKANAVPAPSSKIRPWLQAFDLGAVYTPAMVRAQIQATYDSGLDSWMLWNAGSVYNKNSLMTKAEVASTATSSKTH